MSEQPGISELYASICKWALRTGVTKLNELPECWDGECGGIKVSINAHGEAKKNAAGLSVPPWSAFLERDGWPIGVIDPAGGSLLGVGDVSEDMLIKHFDGADLKPEEKRNHSS